MKALPLNTLIQGDAREVLKTFPDESVHCVIASPPYWGLRDYGTEPLIWGGKGDCEHVWVSTIEPSGQGTGKSFRRDRKAGRKRGGRQPGFCEFCGAWRGNLGLEPTPALYVEHIVEICREIKRVLRSDGIFFLNMGDSYFSGSQRAVSYDTSGKVLEDCRDHDCLCENLCDVCREVYQSHRFHNDGLLASMLSASLSLPSQANKVSQIDHFPTLDFSCLESRILIAIQDFGRFVLLEGEQLLAFRESMTDEFSRQLLVECWQRGSSSLCLLCGRSLSDCVRVSGDKKACTCGIEKPSDASNHHKSDRLSSDLAHPNLTTKFPKVNLKPKDLCGMPWRVVFALQADGWWLRSDIIWSKPNPMPESVTGRPTRSHEYVFLLTKSKNYYYDAEAIKEKMKTPENSKSHHTFGAPGGKAEKIYGEKHLVSGEKWRPTGSRNKRSVWTIATQPFPEAHFATFPEALIRPMILAGTSEKGACAKCGAPWERIVERSGGTIGKSWHDHKDDLVRGQRDDGRKLATAWEKDEYKVKTIGWKPMCECYDEFYRIEFPKARSARKRHQRDAWDGRWRRVRRRPGKDHWPFIPCVVLDPFIGSGTVALVAEKLGRNYIGIDLKQEYVEMAKERVRKYNEQARLL